MIGAGARFMRAWLVRVDRLGKKTGGEGKRRAAGPPKAALPGAKEALALEVGTRPFGFLATRASTRAQQVAQAWLNGHGLKLAYWPVLLALSEGRARSQADLAAFVDRTPAAVSLIVAEMEREGLVERRPNPANRRELLVTLSEPGAHKWVQTADMWRHVNAIAYAGFSAKDIARLADLLSRASANLDSAATLSTASRP